MCLWHIGQKNPSHGFVALFVARKAACEKDLTGAGRLIFSKFSKRKIL